MTGRVAERPHAQSVMDLVLELRASDLDKKPSPVLSAGDTGESADALFSKQVCFRTAARKASAVGNHTVAARELPPELTQRRKGCRARRPSARQCLV